MDKKTFVGCLIAVLFFAGLGLFYFKNRNENIFATVVPHHDIAVSQRDFLFAELAKRIAQPDTIILISPNHADAGFGNMQTTSKDWELDAGKMSANKDVVTSIVKDGLVIDYPESFTYEFGIFNILPHIYKEFPKVKIVPIIFEDSARKEEILRLEAALMKNCKNCLMVASLDFSHYTDQRIAEQDDKKNIEYMKNLDVDSIFSSAKVDSKPALWLLTTWAKDHKNSNFFVLLRTDSGDVSKMIEPEGASHILGWYSNY